MDIIFLQEAIEFVIPAEALSNSVVSNEYLRWFWMETEKWWL